MSGRKVLSYPFLEKMSWANVANENAGRTYNKNSSKPRSGETRKSGKKMEIYTTRPVHLADGRRVTGTWVKAVDPEGFYGGPYADYAELKKHPRYASDMENIMKNAKAYRNRNIRRNTRRNHRSRSGSRSRK